MNAPHQYCPLRFLYQDSDGDVHCVADPACGPCYTVEYADNIAGPWYFDRDGTAGQDIIIEPLRFYRAYSRLCEPGEVEETPTPVPIPPGDQTE